MSNMIILTGARVLFAATTEGLPSDTTIAYGAAASTWPSTAGGWKDVGYTNAPTDTGYNSEMYEFIPEQATQAVETIPITESVTVTTSLVQMKSDNLKLVFPGASIVDTPAGAGQKAVTILKAGGAAARDTYLLCVEGGMKDAANTIQPVRFFYYRAQPRLNGTFSIGKNKEAGLVLEWACLNDQTKTAGQQCLEWHFVTGPASS